MRLPSHIDPPFRGSQWINQEQRGNIVDGFLLQTEWRRGIPTPGTVGVFGQGTQFPAGMRGELAYLHFAAASRNVEADFTAPFNNLALDLFKNGTGVEGFRQLRPEFESSAGTGGFFRVLRGEGPRVLAPIHLEEDDRLDLEVTIGAGSQWYVTLSWGGWIYPALVAGDAGSIRESQQDPRARDPLGPRW